MSERPETRLARWPSILPFLIGAALLDYFAWWVVEKSDHPINIWMGVLALVAVGGAAWVSVIPFLTDAQNATRIDELDKLQSTANQIQNLEKVANQITIATAQWQNVQEHNAKAIESAKQVSDEMSQEAMRFAEFMKKASDSEKATLRLEVEKLKRSENDWLQVLVRVLDRVTNKCKQLEALVARRQQAHSYSAETLLDFEPAHFQQAAAPVALPVPADGAGEAPDAQAAATATGYASGPCQACFNRSSASAGHAAFVANEKA